MLITSPAQGTLQRKTSTEAEICSIELCSSPINSFIFILIIWHKITEAHKSL